LIGSGESAWTSSDPNLIELELPSPHPSRYSKGTALRSVQHPNPHLRFKRGTEPFQVHYLAMENALIADARLGRSR
jgi:hypothetical protein